MSQYVESACKADTAAAAIAQYLRVKTAGALAVAGATDAELGTMEVAATAAGPATVRLRTAQGTCKMVASAAITANAYVYAAASGKIASTGSLLIGRALEAATADGDVIEVLRTEDTIGVYSTVSVKTADYTVVAATDVGKTFTTTGAAGTVTFAMPAATVGQRYRFFVGAVQELRIDPNGTETISLPSTGVAGAAGKYLTANAIGETVDIECCVAGSWAVFGFTGTWTAEA